MKLSSNKLALFVLLAAFGAGCSFSSESKTLVENRCRTESDCQDASCDIEIGMCVSTAPSAMRVVLELVPMNERDGLAATPIAFDPIDINGPTEQNLMLPSGITVVGTVRWDGLSGRPVPAEVSFFERDELEGLASTPIVTTTQSASFETAVGEADYTARLVTNASYSVLVEPRGDAENMLPPLWIENVKIGGNGDMIQFPIPYWSLEAMPLLHGQIVDAEGPVDGLQVRAIETATGRVISSTGITGGRRQRPGEFTLRFVPSSGPYVLRIIAGEDRPLFPTVTVDPRYLYPDEENMARVLVPALQSVQYIGTVEAMSPVGMKVEGASLIFRSEEVLDANTQVTGIFHATATSGRDGKFEVSLLPGTYEVVVTPPSGADMGVLVESVHIAAPAGGGSLMGQLFELPPRAHLGGTVFTSDRRAMAGATVQAFALGATMEQPRSPAAAYNRSNDTVTHATGLFDLPLDVGTYDLVIKPPSGSGFPWIVSPEFVIGEGERVLSGAFEFAAPVPLHGTVESMPGVPVVGVELRAYAIVDAPEGGSRAIQIGTATSDEEGEYMLLLPPFI